MKKQLFIFSLVVSALQCPGQTIIINEVCYSNKNILYDRDHDTPDWFELYNPGNRIVNLAEFKVTDDTSKVNFWRFPEHQLHPGNYIVIFASDKNKRDGEELHTDFRLGNMRESLFLINDLDEIVDEINPECVPVNCSLARFPDGSDNLIVMKPSPGGTNDHSEEVTVNYIKDILEISHPGGLYDGPVTISLTNSHPGNVIMYTLNGDVPDEESPVYGQPVFLEDLTPAENRFANQPDDGIKPGNKFFKANILRAIVYSNGCPASNEISNTYFIGKGIKERYNVPIVSLITDEDNLFDDETGIYVRGRHNNFNQRGGKWERDVHIEIYDSSGIQILDQDAGMRIHGRRTRELPQKSFRFYADDEYGREYFEYPFFSLKPELVRFKTLLLRATNGSQGSLLKNDLCTSVIQDMNINYLASETVVAFVNGEYWGIYNLSERNDRYYVANNYGLADPDIDIISHEWDLLVEEGNIHAYNQLTDYLNTADPLSEHFFEDTGELIDIEGLIDYYITEFYLANADWPKKNLELWKIRSDTSKWRYFFFDPDATMIWVNHNQMADHNHLPEYLRVNPEFSTEIFSTMIRNDEFRKIFNAGFISHLNTTFNPDRVVDLINHFEKIYSPLIPEHIYRWRYPVDYLTWKKAVDRLRNFAVIRPMVLAGQLQSAYGNPFVVYPNPGRGTFNITFSGQINEAVISVFSVSGVKLFQSALFPGKGNNCQFNINLKPGFYLLRLEADGISYSDKLIIR